MAKKGSLLKTVIGLGSLAVAGKVAYDKYRNTKEKYVKEEKESADDVVKKYNAIAESKVIEIQDEEFEGCEIKASASKVVLDLSLAVIEKDVYINFKSQASSVVIVVPEGVNVTCDIEKVASRVRNEVINVDEEGIHTVYVIGNASVSNVDIIPVDFYGEDEDFEEYEMTMSVEIRNDKIVSIMDITGDGASSNDSYIKRAANGTSSIKGVVSQIIDKGMPEDIDTVSRATCSSNAILEGCKKVLEVAERPTDMEAE